MTCSASSATSSSKVLVPVVVVVMAFAFVVTVAEEMWSGMDHGADAFAGEELEEERVGDAAVEDVGAVHSPAQRLDARHDLRDHALGHLAAGHEPFEPPDVGARDQRVGGTE